MPIPASYLQGLLEGDSLAVQAYVSFDGTGNKATAIAFDLSQTYRIKKTEGVIVDTIMVGNKPTYLVLSPDNTRLYVANYGGGNISVINTHTKEVITTLFLPYAPEGIAVHPSRPLLYVSTYGIGTGLVHVFDTDTFRLTKTINTYYYPKGLCLNPTGSSLYIGETTYTVIYEIDTLEYTHTGTLHLQYGSDAKFVTVNPAGTRVYSTGSSTISVFNQATRTKLGSYLTGGYSEGFAISPYEPMLYATINKTNSRPINTVILLDISANTPTLIKTLSGFDGPWGVAFNPVRERAYVAENSGNSIKIIDTASREVIKTITGFDQPQNIAITSDGDTAYVTNNGGGSISVVST